MDDLVHDYIIIDGVRFSELVQNSNDPLELYEVSGKAVIDFDCIEPEFRKSLTIKNCRFSSSLYFENYDLSYPIRISNCTFKGTLNFTNCSQSFEIDDTLNLEVNDCHLETVILYKLRVEKSIRFQNCTMKTFAIREVNIAMSFYSIKCEIETSLIVAKTVIKSIFHFSEGSFGFVTFDSSDFGTLSIRETKCEKDWVIDGGMINELEVIEGEFNFFLIKNAFICDSLTLRESKFHDRLNWFFPKDGLKTDFLNLRVLVTEIEIKDRFLIYGEPNSFISTLHVVRHDGLIEGVDLEIGTLEIHGQRSTSDLNFNNCRVNTFNCVAVISNLSLSTIRGTGKSPRLLFNESNLKNAQFFNVDLKSFQTIEFRNSSFDASTANINWFEDKQIRTPSEGADGFRQKRELYRQLKNNQERQGNRIQSLKFQALETEYYKQELFYGVKRPFRLWKADRIAIWAGKSNEHGQHWGKPVCLAIIIGFGFYWAILVGVSNDLHFTIDLSANSINHTLQSLFIDKIAMWPQLMNPIHDLNKIFPDQQIGFWTHVLDYVLRIIIAFFIFQTVSAFRKFIRV